jgi:DNA repair exonuclease SbcCD ATPase subunit
VGTTASAHTVHSNGVRDWLAAISASQSELDRFLEDVFARVSGLLSEFVHHQKAWEMDRGRVERELRARSNELSRREAELRAERERVQEAAAKPGGSPGVATAAQEELICRMVAELQQERDAMRAAIAAAEGQVGGWGEAAAELAKAREAFLQRSDQDKSDQTAGQAESHRALEEQTHRQGEELSQLEQERATLERELEIVRRRAAELSESLSQQGREMAEQREQWSDELKRMRRLLETVAQRQLAQPAGEARGPLAVAIPAGVEKTPAEDVAGDPVLDSVITQFETLQKDLARRRKAAAG